MANKTAMLSVKILADAKEAGRGFQEAESKLDKLEGRATKAAQGMSVASAGVIALGKQAFDSASSLQQSTGAVESVFKQQADSIAALADKASQAAGLSKNEYNEMAAIIGSQLKNMGVAQEELVGQTDGLIAKGADLAATFGGTTADAVSALSSLLRGETDPIERYGISIKESTISAELAAQGLDKLEGEAAKTARTQAIMNLLSEQSADAMGAFAREADTAAGQQQRAAAEWENAKAQLGEQLLPIVSAAAVELGKMAKFVGEHPQAFQAAAVAVVGVTGALWGIIGAIKAWHAITEAMKIAQIALNFAMSANPIGLVVIAIAALVAGLIYAYQHSETFREIVDGAFRAVAKGAGWLWDKLKELWQGFELLFRIAKGDPDALAIAARIGQAAYNALPEPLQKAIDWIKKVAQWAPKPGEQFNIAKDLFKKALDAIGGWFDRGIENVKGFASWLSSIGENATGFFQPVINMIERVIRSIKRCIEWIQALIDSFDNLSFSGAVDWVQARFSAPHPALVGVPPAAAILYARSTPQAAQPRYIRNGGRLGGPRGGGTTVNIHIDGVVSEDLVEQLKAEISRYEERQSW